MFQVNGLLSVMYFLFKTGNALTPQLSSRYKQIRETKQEFHISQTLSSS